MRAGWHKHLGAAEGLGELQTLGLVNILAEKWQVVLLLFLDVLGEVVHQLLELWDEFGCAGFHVLECFEVFFDLRVG